MLVDWFTVVAQAINFLILVWLLKRFLYGPILDAIDAREQRIAQTLADAESQMVEARQERADYAKRNEELDQQRDVLVQQMKEEVNTTRQRLLDEAHLAADALKERRYEILRREEQNFRNDTSRRVQEEVFSIARIALKDLADATLEERITQAFTGRLQDMNGQMRQDFAEAMKGASDPARVRTAFELPAEQRTAISQTINHAFGIEVPVRFETDADVISGIELIAGGRQIAWSIADYLTSLEQSIGVLTHKYTQAPVDDQSEGRGEPVS